MLVSSYYRKKWILMTMQEFYSLNSFKTNENNSWCCIIYFQKEHQGWMHVIVSRTSSNGLFIHKQYVNLSLSSSFDKKCDIKFEKFRLSPSSWNMWHVLLLSIWQTRINKTTVPQQESSILWPNKLFVVMLQHNFHHRKQKLTFLKITHCHLLQTRNPS